MRWLYHVLKGRDVFLLHVLYGSYSSNQVSNIDVVLFDDEERVWRSSPVNQFRPPKEKGHLI